MVKLNERHKAVIDEYIGNGMNITAAYQKVYKSSYRTANVRGPALMKRDDIKAYLEERQKELEEQRVITILERKKVLEEIIKEGRPKEKISAIELLNKMENVYKNEITVHNDASNALDGLSIEELYKLINSAEEDEN